MSTVAEAIDTGLLGERLWFYANYRCNLACSYCLTESAPDVAARELDGDLMRDLAREGAGLGFRAIGVTGGEPFLRRDMVPVLADLAEVMPVVVLTNGTLFSRGRLDEVRALAGTPIKIQISLDSAQPTVNDEMRGPENFAKVIQAVPALVAMGLTVRIATTVEQQDPADLAAICELHRSLGVSDDEHVVRGIVRRGRAVTQELGEDVRIDRLTPELTITTDGAFWSPFGPTVLGGKLDTDLMVARGVRRLAPAASAMVALLAEQPLAPEGDRYT